MSTSAVSGLRWRLADGLEREKAARGVDGRLAPWGDHFDANFCRVLESHTDTPTCGGVDDNSLDESPYGVRGLAGNTRDWCLNNWTHDGPAAGGTRLAINTPAAEDDNYRCVRGGAWSSTIELSRSATRFALRPHLQRWNTGFRLVRSYR